MKAMGTVHPGEREISRTESQAKEFSRGRVEPSSPRTRTFRVFHEVLGSGYSLEFVIGELSLGDFNRIGEGGVHRRRVEFPRPPQGHSSMTAFFQEPTCLARSP